MNILYIGNYKDHAGGWSNASEMWVRALYKAFPEGLIIRPYAYSNKQRIMENSMFAKLEQKIVPNLDVVIQNVLPSDMVRQDGSYNVGICYFESVGVLQHNLNNWAEKLQQMDEVWVSTKRELRELERANINGYLIPQSIDLWAFKKHKHEKKILKPKENYRFYNIGGDGIRKNLHSLVMSFCLAFDQHDPVELLLKVSNEQYAMGIINSINKRIPKRPNIAVIPHYLNEEDMISFHKECDCYVSTSSEESLSRPLLDACAVGNTTLVTAETSMADITPTPYLIQSETVRCCVDRPPVPGIYTHLETWQMPKVESLVNSLKEIAKIKPNKMTYFLDQYNFKSVANLIQERMASLNAN